MRVALVHDYLVQHGGAERVLQAFSELFPEAPIYTLIYDERAMRGMFSDRDIRTSFLQRFPFAKRNHRLFPVFMPLAIEQFRLHGYDLVLSDSSSYAKGVLTQPSTLHVCYMHTPMRYAWDDCHKYVEDFGFPRAVKRLAPFFLGPIRLWDKTSATRPDRIIANSRFVARRIEKYYRRKADVIHPPIDTERFSVSAPESRKDFFLVVGRLVAYKRHDLAIRAFNELRLPLKIVGRGPEYARLKRIAGPTVEFLGRVPDDELARLYSECTACVFPQEEDFGIVAFEAFASGCPLIAYRGGDIPEHMEEGDMGVFFERQEVTSLVEAVRRFQTLSFDVETIRSRSLRFDREIFKSNMRAALERIWDEWQSGKFEYR